MGSSHTHWQWLKPKPIKAKQPQSQLKSKITMLGWTNMGHWMYDLKGAWWRVKG